MSKFEKAIIDAEEKIAEMDKEFAVLDYTDNNKAQAFLTLYDEERGNLNTLMDEWSKAEEELLQLESQLD